MAKIDRDSLITLEAYARARPQMRQDVIAHKKNRTVHLGEHITLLFEDETTVRYQVLEMLRAERIFEDEAINDELDAYNPLVPDGSNWKATLLIEYPDPEERARQLRVLKGVEDRVWVSVEGERVYAIADEDMERENEEKTSSVHFLRFELAPAQAQKARQGATIGAGVDHPHCQLRVDALPANIRASLASDLTPQ